MSSEQLLNSKHVETDIVIVGAGGADTYNLSTASGTAFGFAINSGRIAGEDAAEYVK